DQEGGVPSTPRFGCVKEDGETDLGEPDAHEPHRRRDDEDLGATVAFGRRKTFAPQPVPPEGEVRRAQERDLPHVPDFRDVPDGAHPSPWSVTRQTPPAWLAAYRPARRV